MADVKQFQLTRAGEWWKHLRPWNKRKFWKAERRAYAQVIRLESRLPAQWLDAVRRGNAWADGKQ
jgi:hypothetical protein